MTEHMKQLRGFIEEASDSVEHGKSPLTALKKLQFAVGELLRTPLDITPMELSADMSEGLLSKESNAEIIETLRVNHEMLVRAKIYEEEFKEQLFSVMESNEIRKTSNDFMQATYIAPSTSKRFDAKRFQEEQPEIAAEYMRDVERKGYVRVSYTD